MNQSVLPLKSEKCHFIIEKVIYHGHIITKEGVQVDPSNTDVVHIFPRPNTQQDVPSVIRLIGNVCVVPFGLPTLIFLTLP